MRNALFLGFVVLFVVAMWYFLTWRRAASLPSVVLLQGKIQIVVRDRTVSGFELKLGKNVAKLGSLAPGSHEFFPSAIWLNADEVTSKDSVSASFSIGETKYYGVYSLDGSHSYLNWTKAGSDNGES